MANLTAYLVFGNNCREAMNFYQKVFGGDLKVMTMADSPMKDQTPPEAKDLVMHAFLQAPGFALMASDGMPGQPPVNGDSVQLAIGVTSVEDAERIYQQLSAGGQVKMPLQETFWAHRYGQFADKFGINWMVSYNKPM
ncbi:VOC family protein [Chitinophaga silvatica]|uniref:VOC family protein n=1 Tax=Chitinophaga silvatica TaxID=2282649 RepID=A0A3E1Y2V5_9BACT|nr:VOC family protein [Chitinophaga silvatica]RFS18992.1 VOC family protein [Chitinophaga silvatica]